MQDISLFNGWTKGNTHPWYAITMMDNHNLALQIAQKLIAHNLSLDDIALYQNDIADNYQNELLTALVTNHSLPLSGDTSPSLDDI